MLASFFVVQFAARLRNAALALVLPFPRGRAAPTLAEIRDKMPASAMASVLVATTAAAEPFHPYSHAEADPQAWQNPQNVIVYINNITSTLSKLDPAGASSYQSNAQAYIKELQALDAWAQEQFASIPAEKRKVITSHDAFAYFAARYNIQFLAAQGTSTETEPSAKQVAKLIKQIQREKIKTVYVENMSNPKLLAQLSKDAGASVGASLYADALSAPDQAGATYLKMMRHNVSQLAAGMR